MKKYFLWAIALIALTACKKDDDKTRIVEMKSGNEYTFKVYVKGFWEAKMHPTDFPSDAKFGKILGITHENKNLLFKEGDRAADYLKPYFAEGNTTSFSSYFNEFQEVDKVKSVFSEDGITAKGETEFTIKANRKHSNFSLIMQLSPSPDWFVAANNINLHGIAEGGYFTYILPIYDAGLFSGSTYNEKGSSTNDAIKQKNDSPVNFPEGGVNKFVTVTIQYESVEKTK